MDELDEFNEAPHIVRERERRRNSPPDDISIGTGSGGGRGMVLSTSIPHSLNGDACNDLELRISYYPTLHFEVLGAERVVT